MSIRISKVIAASSALALISLGLSIPAQSSDWVSDWFSQATGTSAGQYQSQQRGYYTAGGFDARYRMTNDHVISVNPPSIKVGCGGIDLMAGSLSYLNADYIVQKLQRILQAAPAFAFDLAMQEYCKPCTASLQFLEHTADQLNGLQMSDCQSANKLATAIVKPSTIAADLQGLQAATTSTINGLQDSWEQFQSSVRANDGKSPNPATTSVAGCPSDFTNVFTNGSIVGNATSFIGLSGYASLMRGLIGDVLVTFNTSTNNYQFTYLAACQANNGVSGENFYNGTLYVEDTNGSCTQPASSSVLDYVNQNLVTIAGSLQSHTALNSTQIAFINASPIPLYNILKDAVAAGNSDQVISILDTVLAQQYTTRVLGDFYQMAGHVMSTAARLHEDTASGAGGNSNSCGVLQFEPAFEFLRTMRDRTASMRSMALQAAQMSVSEAAESMQFSAGFSQQHTKVLNRLGTTMDRRAP